MEKGGSWFSEEAIGELTCRDLREVVGHCIDPIKLIHVSIIQTSLTNLEIAFLKISKFLGNRKL